MQSFKNQTLRGKKNNTFLGVYGRQAESERLQVGSGCGFA